MTTADEQGPGANVLGAGGGYLDSAGPVKVVLYEDAVPPASFAAVHHELLAGDVPGRG